MLVKLDHLPKNRGELNLRSSSQPIRIQWKVSEGLVFSLLEMRDVSDGKELTKSLVELRKEVREAGAEVGNPLVGGWWRMVNVHFRRLTRWWIRKRCFMFTPILGEMIQ